MTLFNALAIRNLTSTGNASRIYDNDVTAATSSSRREAARCAAMVTCFVTCWLPNHALHLAKMTGVRGTVGFAREGGFPLLLASRFRMPNREGGEGVEI